MIVGPAPTGSGPRTVGVMGGTFDPIHLGHLAVAEEAREALGLRTILFVPAGVPPHKPQGAVASTEDRVAMVALAIAGNPSFALSRVDVDRSGPSYTSESMALLRRAMLDDVEAGGDGSAPLEADPIRLTLIMSTETLAGLPDWRNPRRLLEECRVAVVPREGHAPPKRAWLARHFPGLEGRFDLLAGPRLGISSTEIRDRVAAGRSIRYLVPDAVERYITDHHLYARAFGAS
ncbi:MAG: nicotinate (nicotinamide) nucleotide adenylyltransferase [Chloroflexota bacterium]|nr:MAG: nicotinate (nicotinamide) nucleotide adenylyltransferase [Chloroflexota bacterium]